MNRRLVIVVSCILLGTTFIPVVESEFSDEKVSVKVSTSIGKTMEQMVSIRDVEKLSSTLNILQENLEDFKVYLPVVLKELVDLGLIEDASQLEKAILENVKTPLKGRSPYGFPFLFNLFCFMVGYGDNAFIYLPRFFPIFLTMSLLLNIFERFPLICSRLENISYFVYLYSVLRPRLSFLSGGWVVARRGKIHTLGLLGYHQKSISKGDTLPLPSIFYIFGFTGLWIGFLRDNYEQTFFIGSSVAIIGG